jgi:chorismate mutase
MAAELSIEALREEIDRIDEVIVRLLDRRARCAYAIGRLKREQQLGVYEPAREAAVMAHVKEVNSRLGGPLNSEAILRLYERIMDEARRIQRIEHDRATAGETTDGGQSPGPPAHPGPSGPLVDAESLDAPTLEYGGGSSDPPQTFGKKTNSD